MMGLGLFSSDIYLPAVPELHHYFGSQALYIESTFSIYFFGMGVCQFFYGIWLDQFGLKRTFYFGLLVFILAS